MARIALLLTLLLPLSTQATFRPFIVSSSQKISDTEGYLSGPGSPGSDPGGLLADGDRFGGVAGLGLLDGDGVPDLAVGAYRRDLGGPNRGAVFVLLLNADGSVRSRVEIGHGSAGLTLADGDEFGRHVVALGDVDGDGVTDLAADASRDDTGGASAGAVYILFLNADGTLKDFTKIASGVGGGPTLGAGDRFGVAMGGLGDLNADGVPDLAVGAFQDDDAGSDAGAVYLLTLKGGVGEPNPGEVLGTPLKIRAGLNGFTGPAGGQWFGRDVTVVGDLDGDLRPELAVGAGLSDVGGADKGEVWLLSLRTVAAGDAAGDVGQVFAETRIGALSGGFPGSQLDANDQLGTGLAPLGDLDGDGIPDLAVNAPTDDDGGTDRGAVWLLYLDTDGSVKQWDKLSDTRGCFGGGLDDGDVFGVRMSLLGDLSGDGTPELAVSATADDDGGADRGAVHVLSLEQPAQTASHQLVCASMELELDVNRPSAATIALRQGVSNPISVSSPLDFIQSSSLLSTASGTFTDLFSGAFLRNFGYQVQFFTAAFTPASGALSFAPSGVPPGCAVPWHGGVVARVGGGDLRAFGGPGGTFDIGVGGATSTTFATLFLGVSGVIAAASTDCSALGAASVRMAGLLWTDGTASVFYRTNVSGNPLPNATATRRGVDARTLGGAGHLNLVTPIAIQSSENDLPSFGRLNLTFVPEPAPLLGLLSGAAAVGVLGARRRRR